MAFDVKKLPLVLITWKDITSSNTGWIHPQDIDKLEAATCYTPGWVLKEDTSNYYIVSSLLEHCSEWSGSFDTVIPKGVVVDIQILNKASWRKKRTYKRKTDFNPADNLKKSDGSTTDTT